MATAATIVAVLQLADGDYNSKLKQAERTAAGFAAKAGQSFVKAGKAFTIGLTAPIVAGMTKSVLAAGDLEQATGAVDVVFGDLADTIHEFAETSAESAGMAQSDFKQLATEAGALLLNLGVPLDETADKTQELALRAADMAAVYNTDVTDAMEAIESGLRGMGRPLLAYGVNLDVATVKAKALEMGLGGANRELTTQEEAYARLAIIMEQTDRIQGHFAKEAETMDGQIKRLKANFKDTAAELGEHLLPYVTDFLKQINILVVKFGDLNDKQQINILKWAGIAAAIGPTLLVIGNLLIALPKLQAGWTTLNSIMGLVGGTATGLAGTLGAVGIAVAGVVAGYAKQAKVRKEEIAGQKDLGDSILDTSESYDEYLKQIDAENAKWDKVAKTTGGFGQLAASQMRLEAVSKETYNLSHGLDELGNSVTNTIAPITYMTSTIQGWEDAYKAAGVAQLDMQVATLGMMDTLAPVAEQFKQDYEDINKSIEDYSRRATALSGVKWKTADQKQEVANLRSEYQELVNKLREVEAAHTQTVNQMILDMARETLATGGWTEEKMQRYLDIGKELGLMEDGFYNMAAAAVEGFNDVISGAVSARDYASALRDILNEMGGKTYMPKLQLVATLTGNSAAIGILSSGVKLDVSTGDASQRAFGGAVIGSTPYLVGEKGPELFVPNDSGEIIPNNELGGQLFGQGDQIDYKRMAVAFRDALMGVV